jgi:hypothetical protein
MSVSLRSNLMSHAPAAVKRIRQACLAWLRIYGGPEIAGLLAAALAFGLVRASGGPLLGSAFLGSWAEDIAFVGYFAVRAVRKESRHHRQYHWMKYYLFTFGLAFWGLIIELGPAEAVDKFTRPALLYEIPRSLHNITAGFILAKIAADIVYYILAYAGRSIRKRYFNNQIEPAAHDPASQAPEARAIAAFKTIAGTGGVPAPRQYWPEARCRHLQQPQLESH